MTMIDQQPKLIEDAHIEMMLTRDAEAHRDQYIDNDGFSTRVMSNISVAQPSTALSNQSRLTIIAVATLLATVIAMTTGAGSKALIDAVMDLATKTISPSVVGLVLLIVSACVMAISVASHEK